MDAQPHTLGQTLPRDRHATRRQTEYPAAMAGLTLLELLITVSLLVIAATAGLPAFGDFLNRQRSEATLNQLFTELRFARQLAVSRRATVTLCGTDDGHTCSKQWSQTVLVFDDLNQDRIWQEKDEPLYRRSDYHNPKPILFRLSRGDERIRFKPIGTVSEFGSISDCANPQDTAQSRTLVLARSGRSRLVRGPYPAAADCENL